MRAASTQLTKAFAVAAILAASIAVPALLVEVGALDAVGRGLSTPAVRQDEIVVAVPERQPVAIARPSARKGSAARLAGPGRRTGSSTAAKAPAARAQGPQSIATRAPGRRTTPLEPPGGTSTTPTPPPQTPPVSTPVSTPPVTTPPVIAPPVTTPPVTPPVHPPPVPPEETGIVSEIITKAGELTTPPPPPTVPSIPQVAVTAKAAINTGETPAVSLSPGG
jgi:hypothetical protein